MFISKNFTLASITIILNWVHDDDDEVMVGMSKRDDNDDDACLWVNTASIFSLFLFAEIVRTR